MITVNDDGLLSQAEKEKRKKRKKRKWAQSDDWWKGGLNELRHIKEKGEIFESNVRAPLSAAAKRKESTAVQPTLVVGHHLRHHVPSITALRHSGQCFNYGNLPHRLPPPPVCVRSARVWRPAMHHHHHHQMSILNFCPSADTAADAAVAG